MQGQIDIFDYMDSAIGFHSCLNCKNCRQTDLFKPYVDSKGVYHNLGFCNLTRQVITEHTLSWICKNRDFEKKGAK